MSQGAKPGLGGRERFCAHISLVTKAIIDIYKYKFIVCLLIETYELIVNASLDRIHATE